MKICGMCVCVDYADLFENGIARWSNSFDRFVVITTARDTTTIELCKKFNVETHITDIFYANGAKFNKGAALSEAVIHKQLRQTGWWLSTVDADIVPPMDWRQQVEQAGLRPGELYGAYRYWVDESARGHEIQVLPRRRMPQSWVIGFFMLFHNEDPVLKSPLFDYDWPHAGNYDTLFCRQWPPSRQVLLPIPMIHMGDERKNWCGRHARHELDKVLAERRAMEDWERERMDTPPQIKEL